jgi:thiol-disulfide isomerase/thioredoxin
MFQRRFLLLLLAPISALCLAACSSSSSTDTDQWPSTEVVDVSTNSSTSTSNITGENTTLINLWALWCAPCREELPRLQEVSANSGDELDVVGINIGDDFDRTTAYIEEAGLTFPMYWDETGDLLTALKVPSVPATLAINTSGDIIWFHLGALSAEELQSKVEELTSS